MPEVSAKCAEAAQEAFAASVELYCRAAFPHGFRVAVSPPEVRQTSFVIGGTPDEVPVALSWEFLLLGPGEFPPARSRWTIYENHAGHAVGRSA